MKTRICIRLVMVLAACAVFKTEELAAASAVANCRETGVYAAATNCRTEEEAKQQALNSARKRGATNARIIVSCARPGYGAISIWRPAGQRIKAIGASCGAATREAALMGAQHANKLAGGPGPAPRVAWHDTVGE